MSVYRIEPSSHKLKQSNLDRNKTSPILPILCWRGF